MGMTFLSWVWVGVDGYDLLLLGADGCVGGYDHFLAGCGWVWAGMIFSWLGWVIVGECDL